MLNNLFASKFGPSSTSEGLSKAVKQISGVHHVDYMVGAKSYTLVIPPQKRRVRWNQALAFTSDEEDPVDVTELIAPYAGPYGNFMNFDYQPHHLVRNAIRVTILHDGVIVREFGVSK